MSAPNPDSLPIFAVELRRDARTTVHVQAADWVEAEAAAWELVDWEGCDDEFTEADAIQLPGLPRGPARYWVDGEDGHWVEVEADGSGGAA